MEVDDIRKFIVEKFGTPKEYSYLAVLKLDTSEYCDIYEDGSLLCKLYSHSVVVPILRSRITIKYITLHELKLVVFQNVVTKEDT